MSGSIKYVFCILFHFKFIKCGMNITISEMRLIRLKEVCFWLKEEEMVYMWPSSSQQVLTDNLGTATATLHMIQLPPVTRPIIFIVASLWSKF